MHYYIISGELSGDLYGSKLIHSLKQRNKNSQFTCWGGNYMKYEGGRIVRDLDCLSFMGFLEVFTSSLTIFKNFFSIIQKISDGMLVASDVFGDLEKFWLIFRPR